MLERRGVSWVAALALALVGAIVVEPTTARAATTITVSAAQNVQAQLALHYGSTSSSAAGGTANYLTGDCLRLGSRASVATTGTVDNTGGSSITSATTGNTAYVSGGSMAWVSHGTNQVVQSGRTWTYPCPTTVNLDQQSSLGFAPASVSTLAPGTIFNLGRMAHRNLGIYLNSGNSYFRGNLNLQFMGMALSFAYEMNETSGSGVADTTTFLNQVGTQTFTHDGLSYTLVVRGFTGAGTGGTCTATLSSVNTVTTTFTTAEDATTWGCLYAQIQQVRPLTIVTQAAAPYGAPASYLTFSYTASSDLTGSPWGSSFSLAPTGTGAAGQATRTADLATGQTINIAQVAPTTANWAFGSLSCVDGAGNTSIPGLTVSGAGISLSGDYSTDTAAAAPITCTFTNTYTPRATLTLAKQVTTTGQPAPQAVAADWTLSATGTGAVAGQAVSGASGSTTVTGQSVIAGSYTLGEVGANPATTAGYVQDGAWSCTAGTLSGNTLALTNGQNATCTVRNRFATGSVAITKTVTGGGYSGGTSKAFSAAYSCTWGTSTVRSGTVTVYPGAANGTAGAPVTIDHVPAGSTCTVTETDPPTGTSTDLVNPSWDWSAPANPAPVTIAADATATVNITNATSRQLGSLRIEKAITPRSDVPGGGYTGGTARTFPVSYACELAGTTVSSGTVNVSPDAPVTIAGVPASSTCSVTGEDQAAADGDFADASYSWDGYTASDPVSIRNNSTGTVVVTNHFRRDLVTLNLAATVTGGGYAGSGTDFRLGYDCGAPYAGSVDLADGGSQAVTVPAGVACTVTGDAPSDHLLRPGYVWDDATYAGLSDGTVVVPRGGSATVTVTNPTRTGYGRIQVTKKVASSADQVASGTTFDVRVACDAPAQGTAGDYTETFTLQWPAAVTALTPYLPAGASCTVTETDAPDGHEALPNASYAWAPVPDPVTVTVPASENPRNANVTNDVRRVYAPFRIVKDLVNRTGHDAGGSSFGGSWTCDYNAGESTRSGSWGITGQGTAETVDVLVGSVCTVTEDNPGVPVPGDRSYTWSTQAPADTAVGADGATATVTNTLNRAEGSFNVAKSVEGGTAGDAFPAGTDFGFSWTCTPLTGDPLSGSFSVAAGDSRAPGEAIPGGSTCTVTEGDFPGTIDPYRWDDVRLSVSGDASNSGQSGRSITFTTTEDAQPVAVRAVNTISAKTASVRVTKTVTGETAGYTGGAVFPVTLSCDTGAQGTRNVAAGDAVTFDGIPVGSTCSATEGSPDGGLADGSYAWDAPTIGDPVRLSDTDTREIAISNPIRRVYAGIEVVKVVDDNGFSGVADPTQEFSGTWSCAYDGADPVSGTWRGTGSSSGTLATLTGDADHVLVGSRCTVAEDTSFAAPSSDPSYRWDATPAYDGATVAAGEPNRMSVTNRLLRDTGKVLVTKQLTGETAGYAPAGGFAGFSVTARCYLADPDEAGRLEATVAVRPGEVETVIDDVPFGWTCTLTEGSFPSPDQLRDASYAWDSQSVAFGNGTDTVRVTAGNDQPQAVVSNGIRRVTGSLAVTKAFGSGTADAVQAGTTFTGGWECTYGADRWSGTWSATGAGPATLTGPTDIPLTAECTASEDAPSDSALQDSSWTWAEPDLGGTVRVASQAEPAELVVTNTAGRRWSGLRVTKTYDGPAGAFDAAATVRGTWQCVYRGQVAASGSWVLPASGGSTVIARPSDLAIPATSLCSVAEDSLDPGLLTDSSYAWGTTTYSPASGAVTTVAEGTASVDVANTATRVRESFTVTKQLALGNGVTAAALESDLTFAGSYRCTHPGDDPVTGSWGPVAAGADWTSPPVLVGSSCSVTAEDEPAAPSRTDDSYLWGTPDLGSPVSVVAAGAPRPAIVVTNPVARVTGSFGVTKVVTGDTEGISPSATFSFTWQCEAGNGDLFPADGPGSFGLAAGSTWNAPEDVPAGSDCEVTEDAPPAASDPSYDWTLDLDVVNATGTTAGRTIGFTLPRSGDPVSVTATNALARTLGSFSLAKSADPADGATVLPGQEIHYTVAITPAAVGFTRDVEVRDALATVLAHADVTAIVASQGSAVLDGTDLVWTAGTVRAGTTPTLTYTATVHADAVGADLTNTVSATGEVPPAACGAACTTTHHTPGWTLAKTSDPANGAIVEPGDVITWTLTATNTSQATVTGATATDDLSGLADAVIGFSSAQLDRTGDVLTWTIPTMAPGETRTVSYTGTVRAGADGATLANVATPHGAGASCPGGCRTTQGTAEWTLAKSSDPASGTVVAPGDLITYTLAVTNTGPVGLIGASVTDDVADLLDDATLGTLPAGLTRSGDTLTWAVPTLAVGETATVTYTATVAADALGATLANTAAPASAGGHCDGGCATVQYTPAWSLAKTSDPADGATVEPGDTLTYTLTVTNDGPATLTGAQVSDDLADVLDDGTLVAVPAGATLTGGTLAWAVPDVASGASVSLSYAVRVTDDGATLRNSAVPAGTGGSCGAACSTTHYTPAWTLAKTSDPASGASVAVGDVVTWTLTAINTGQGVVTGASATDDLSSVLANAEVAFTSPQLSRDDTTLTWAIPTLLPGERASVTYTGTVRAAGVTLTNTVTASGAGGTCLACSTSQSTPKWGLTKISDPASGSTVLPGQLITYTLTVANEGPVPVTGATVSDDLSGALDDATLGPLPAGLTRTGDRLTWTVPELPVGGVASISYPVVVGLDAAGATITNSATPVGAGGHCALDCTTTAFTDAWTLAKASTPGDGATVLPGESVDYTLTVTNTGGTTLRGAVVADDLADVLDDADLGPLPAGATLAGDTLTWLLPDVAAGASVTLEYTATVKADATGGRLRNTAAPASTGGTCAGTCTTTQHTPAWTLAKTSEAASGVVEPGQLVTWTLTATNTSQATVTGATATDDLTSVLASADVELGSTELALAGGTLTWTIPTLAPGQTRTVTYTGRVHADATGRTLANTAVPQGAGGSCDACTTTHTTPGWTLAKTSDPASGTVVEPGDVVGYTLTVTNTGPATLSGAVVSDDVSDLVDAAALGALPDGVTRSGDTLTWAVPEVAPGATTTVTYAATVDSDVRGATLANTAAPASAGGSCTRCATTHQTPAWELAKTSDAGAVVHPGDVVGYTLTVTNTGPATLTGAQVSDDLADVLDDATLVAVPAGATLAGDTLDWAVPDVAPGAAVTLDYAVTVTADGATLTNTASPASAGGRCGASCTTTTGTPAWTLAKTSDPASGATVEPGDVITWTLTATNSSAVPVDGATATDDLTGVLAHTDVEVTSAQLTRVGTTLTWTIPTLAPGETRTVSYTGTVRTDGATITNSATPNGLGGACAGGASGCSTTARSAQWTLAKTSDADAVVNPGDVVTYTLTATNTGPVAVSGATVVDDVSDVVDDAALDTLPADLTRSGDTLTWAVPGLAVGASASVSYAVTVAADADGATLRNTAVPGTPGGQCGASCTTTTHTPAWELAKASSVGPGATVEPGGTVDYTLTVTNTGPATLSAAQVADDLSAVLDDATLVAVPAGATLAGDTLEWAVPDVPAGASATLTYQVVVAADAVGATLANTAAPASPGGSCASAAACATTAYTPAWTLAKSSDPASGATVAPGDVITYTLVATNTSDAQVRGALALDDLSGVLPHADVAFTSAQLSRSGDLLTWAIPILAPGETASVTYTATVRADADGVTVVNRVTPVGAGGSCVGGCATTAATGAWRLAKSTDAGAVVLPGDTITYTLTVANTGPVAVSGALVADDLTEVLDDAIVSDLGPGLVRTGSTLVWAVPDLPAGGTASVSYSATVAAGAVGATLTNTATPVSSGGRCASCTTTQTTPAWELAKTSDPADGATVAPGATIRYTLTVSNTGAGVLSGAVVSDDVSDVVDDAALGALPAGLSRSGDTLSWAVPEVAVGGTVSVTYTAVVGAAATGATLRNVASPASVGGRCGASCATSQVTGSWTLTKTSSPGDGAVVAPGDVITWTLTATNTSAAVVSGVRATDDLSGVVDDATVSFTSPQLSRTGDTLAWAIPTLAPGATASVSYTGVVLADGATITNTVAPVGAGGSCTTCSTTQHTRSWTVAKTSDPASGTVVEPGSHLSYTLTVANRGPVPLTDAVVSDDVSGLVDDAVLGPLPAGLARSGDTLTWTVPDVAPGATAQVTYTATVAADALGASLANTATPVGPGGSCDGVCTTMNYTSSWSLVKSSDADAATVVPGATVGYSLTVTNTGPAALVGARVVDELADVLDDAVLVAVPDGAVLTGSSLAWSVPVVPVGGSVTLEYSVVVAAGADGVTLRNVASPASGGGSCAGSCETVSFTAAWTLAKSSDAAAVVATGDVITYTLTATNTSAGVVSGAVASDDLSGVVDDASVEFSSPQLSRSGDTLAWAIPTLAPGETASVSYTATVLADGATITNTVVPVGPGGECRSCSTTSHTPAWTLAKTSDPVSGTVVNPGDVITYTLSVTNTGPVSVSGAQVRDDISDVVDDALLQTLPAGLARSGDTLTWDVPELPAGATASVTYTATVTALGARLRNTAEPVGAGAECLVCTTEAFTPSWTLAKASDETPGAVVRPGDTIGYTLTVTNTGPATLTGALVSDDLADVLDDASLVAVPDGATLTGTTLSWAVPEVPVGGSIGLAYEVVLADTALGATVRNLAAPASVGGSCPEGCETVAHTTAWTLAKTSDPGNGATVVPGDEITYTLTVTNTGPVALTGAVVDDDMTNLLDDAALVGDLPSGTTLAGDHLTWRVPDVPVDGTATVSYTVRVRAGAYGATLGNVASGEGATSCALAGLAPIDADATGDCRTRHFSPAWELSKTSDPGSGATVVPGTPVTYTLLVRNTSQAVLSDAVVTDDLADVFRYATIGLPPDGTTLAGPVLTWTVPVLQPGEEASISYTVLVSEDESAYNGRFTNTAVPSAGGTCDVCTSELATSPAVVDPTHDDGGDDDGSGGTSGDLAYTGSDLGVLGLAAVALAAGAGLLMVGRRRRPEEE